ncbi:hypothetical protein JYT20_00095 [Rhodothermus sp. AH-315-K08]|nr:hypothetical protein [Rhodothermus sp. AH-315-K08]
MPFYRKLSETRASGSGVALAVVVPQPGMLSMEKVLVREAGLLVDTLVAIAPGELGIASVPGILLLDERGLVLNYWRGVLDAASEKELLDLVSP